MPDTVMHHGDIAQVIILSKSPVYRAYTIRWYQLTDTYPGDDDASWLAIELFRRIAGTWNAGLATGCFIEAVWARRFRPTIGDWHAHSEAILPSSRLPGAPQPPQVAFLIRLIATTSTRRLTGRTYLPFVSTRAMNEHGTFSPGVAGRMGNIGNELTAAADTTTEGGNGLFLPGLYHRSSLSLSPLDSHELSHKWATQRRRYRPNQPYGLPTNGQPPY